ncbi:MAG TPA: sulfatase-like hydrolase/transferase [Anaerolineales bacterium]|nr:sulfatase-like hydrolase/transferase [Anaerolineales bacterium]
MRMLFSRIPWDRLAAFPWHTLFIALYAPLGLGAHNIGQTSLSSMVRAVILSGIFAVLILFVCWVFLRRWQAAGVVATLLMILFLTYGHLYNLIGDLQVGGFLIGRHRYLAPAWFAIACLGIWQIARKPRNYSSVTSILNLMSLILMAMPVAQLSFYAAREAGHEGPQIVKAQESQVVSRVQEPDTSQLRDVYYIVLDAYGRSDLLSKALGYDNSNFLRQLQDMGFYVAQCAQSNYAKTDLSLSSSLNMDYVTALDSSLTSENTDRVPLWNMIKDNRVQEKFHSLGYTTIALETGFYFSQLNNLDIFYSPERGGFNEFEILYVRTTLLRLLDDAGGLARFHYTPEDRKRELILFDLKKLQELPALPGPKFVFAHLVIPHQPFVFGPHGEPLVIPEKVHKGQTYYTESDYRSGYINQITFINDRIIRVVQSIIENSSVAPIIIIQGDHGPSHYDTATRMGILNAYYLPNAQPALYAEITPVNSFRLLFNTYFGEELRLLEDVSYYSEYPEAYRFEIIPNLCLSKPE